MGAGRRRSKSRKGRVLHWTRTWPSEWSSHARRRKRFHGTLASGSYRTLRWPSPEFLHSSVESAEPAEANETSRDCHVFTTIDTDTVATTRQMVTRGILFRIRGLQVQV